MRGPVFPDIIQAFALNHTQASLFFSVASMVSVLGALAAPMLIRRRGHIFSLLCFLILMALGFWGYSFAYSYPWMLACSAVFGFSIGGLSVTQNLLVLLGSDDEHRQRAQSGLHACYGASSLLAPWIIVVVAGLGLPWTTSFLPSPVLALLLVFAVFFFLPRSKWMPNVVQQKIADAALHEPAQRLTPAEIFWAVLLAIYVGLEIMMATRLTMFLRESFGRDLNEASLLTSLFFVGLFAGRLTLSFYKPKISLKAQMLICLGFSLVLFAAGFLISPIFLSLTGFAISGFYPVWMTSLSKIFPLSVAKVASLGIGLTGVTVVSMHTIVGQLSDHFGLVIGFTVAPLLAFLCILMIVTFPAVFGRKLP